MRIDRLTRLPALCDPPTPNTPADNFEVFARTWAEHYILFDQKDVNWNTVVAANRSRVTAHTTPAELFDILQSMIEPFHDRHTFIRAPKLDREFSTFRVGTDRVMKGSVAEFRSTGMPSLLAITDRAYFKTPLRKYCNGKLWYPLVWAGDMEGAPSGFPFFMT